MVEFSRGRREYKAETPHRASMILGSSMYGLLFLHHKSKIKEAIMKVENTGSLTVN